MRFSSSTYGQLIEPLNRRQFDAIVDRHDGNAYDKSFESWDHLLVLMFAQLSGADSLRGLEAAWHANRQHHYHLASKSFARSTLSDASRRRPVAVFGDAFALVAGQLDRHARSEGKAMIRLIDSTPIPLGALCRWAKWNGRTTGMKVHVVYDPHADVPRVLDITDANVNDAQVGRTVVIEPGATYVFDKGYCHYGWWSAIDAAGSHFVTRPKSKMGLTVISARAIGRADGDGFTVIEDDEVRFSSKGDSKLPIQLRRLVVRRHEPKDTITLLTNDLDRSAVEIAALYKARWQIELLFRWIKQHLKVRKFLGNNSNAIKLQLYAAMLVFALIRIAARANRLKIPILRFLGLVSQCLFYRRSIATIDQPTPLNPSTRKPKANPDQLSIAFA